MSVKFYTGLAPGANSRKNLLVLKLVFINFDWPNMCYKHIVQVYYSMFPSTVVIISIKLAQGTNLTKYFMLIVSPHVLNTMLGLTWAASIISQLTIGVSTSLQDWPQGPILQRIYLSYESSFFKLCLA